MKFFTRFDVLRNLSVLSPEHQSLVITISGFKSLALPCR